MKKISKRKKAMSFKISVIFLREGGTFIAYSPALDLSTCAKTAAQAKRRFEEAATLFFQSLSERGTIEATLLDLGWRKQKENWQPPIAVAEKTQTVRIPVYS